jgi:hypothetical protein
LKNRHQNLKKYLPQIYELRNKKQKNKIMPRLVSYMLFYFFIIDNFTICYFIFCKFYIILFYYISIIYILLLLNFYSLAAAALHNDLFFTFMKRPINKFYKKLGAIYIIFVSYILPIVIIEIILFYFTM